MKQNLLFVAKGMPNKIKSGGDFRAYNMLKILKNEYDLFVIANSADYGQSDVKGIGCESYLAGDIFSTVKELFRIKNFEIVILSGWAIAQQLFDFIRELSSSTKIVVDTIDVEFLRNKRESEFKKIENPEFEILKRQELQVYRKADLVITTSTQDKEELLKHYDFNYRITKIIELPCLFEVNNSYQSTSGKNAYTIANWTHRPNVEATIFLCQEIIPKTDLNFYIVGKHPPDAIRNFASNKITICGAEYEIERFLTKMNLLLAPVFYSAGMNSKIGQGLAFGIPTVTTTMGAEPYGLIHEESVMIGDNVETFLDSINKIIKDEELRKKLSLNGRSVMENYTIQKWKDSFLQEIK